MREPVEAEPPRRGVEVRVLTDDDVALLEPKRQERLESVRPNAQVLTKLEQVSPESDRSHDVVMELVGHFSSEAQPENATPHASDVGQPVPQVRRWIGDAGALEQPSGVRSRDVDRAERPRLIEDADVGGYRLGPVPNPPLRLRSPAARE